MHYLMKSLLLNIVLFLFIVNNHTNFAQELDQTKFDEQMLMAFKNKDDSQVQSLIQQHRFMVKPFIDDQLNQSIKAELQDNLKLATQKNLLCKKVAQQFKDIHKENSLIIALEYLENWNKDQKFKKLQADSLYESGTALRVKGGTRDQALYDYERAVKLYREIGDKRGEGTTLGGMGFIYWYKKEPENALHYFKKALQVRLAVDDKALIGNSYNDIGFSVCWYYLKDFECALENLLQSAKIRNEIGDLSNYGKTLSRIGRTYEDLGQMDNALDYYAQAANEFKNINDNSRMVNALYDYSIVLVKLGRYPQAIDCLRRSLPICEEIDDKKKQGNILGQIGITSKALGNYEEALTSYEKMLNLMININDERGVAQARINIGVVLRNLSRQGKAAGQFSDALQIFTKLNDQEGILDALSNLGLIYLDSKEYLKAQDFFSDALQISKKLHDKTTETNNLVNLGNTYNFQGKLDSALVYYQEALSNAENLKSPILIWASYLGIGDNYERRQNYGNAIDYYDKALTTIEKMHVVLQGMSYKATFLADQRYVYEAVIHLLDQLYQKNNDIKYADLAFKYAERGKARAFLDMMVESLAKVREGADSKLLQEQEELLMQISANQNQIQRALSSGTVDDSTLNDLKKIAENLGNQYTLIKMTIKDENPKYAQLQYPQPATIKSIQSNLLNDNTILLEYILGDSSSSLWVITDKEIHLFNLPKRQELANQIEMMQFTLQNPANIDSEIFAKSSNKLYKTLIGPAEDIIKNGKQLIIIPDGILNYLPFETLVIKTAGHDFQNLPYLIRTNPISYAPSASVLLSIRTSEAQKVSTFQKELLALGDPYFGENEEFTLQNILGTRSQHDTLRGNLVRLKYSGEEVRNIADLFPKSKVDIFLRQDASEEKIKSLPDLDQYRYIHFATHGLINDKKPDFSSLALSVSQTSRQDGFLQAAEIFNLRLNAELVVLSACQTGLGKMVRGEGMIGLTRSFIYAGASSVTVSLWNVSDKSTSELMKNYYKNLSNKNKTKAEALRQAKIDLIKNKQLAHPFYWAPFVLIGEWK